VNGTGFVSGAVVNWNGSARTTTFVNSSQVTAAITAADIASARTAVVTVTNPAPGGGTSNPECFQVTNPTVGLAFQDTSLSVGLQQRKPAVADFNGDGKLDIAVVGALRGTAGNELQILFGNGDGTVQAPVNVVASPAGTFLQSVTTGDFNGDGKLDLVVSYLNNSGPTVVFATATILGNGDGTFGAPVTSPINHSASMTLVADVNRDGILDLVHACGIGICVELGNGDGTFRTGFSYTPPIICLGLSCNPLPVHSVTLGDFHKNGKLDIVATVDPSYLVMLPGNGDGTFGAASVVYGLDALQMDSVVAGDFYNTGNLALAVYYQSASAPQPPSSATGAALSIFQGNGDGTFQAPHTLGGLPESPSAGPGKPPQFLSVLVPGDFNGDGHVDLAVQNIVILIGNGNGPLSYSVISTPFIPPTFAMVAGDFNGDGRLDLAGEENGYDVLHVMLQTAPPVDFQGAINPSYQTIVTGGTASYTITETAIDGFAGTIEFSASGLPEGAKAEFTPRTVSGSGSTTLTIRTTHATPTGSYQILLTGTSGTLIHSGGVNLNVGPAGTNFADFTGEVQPAGFQTTIPGGNATFNINLIPLNGFNSDVSMSVSGLPAGATAAFNPTVVPSGSGWTVLTISTTGGTATATYQVVITSTGGGRTHSNTVGLNVGPVGTDFTDFTGSVTPESQTVKAGGSAAYAVTVQPLYGAGCVILQTPNLPPATSAVYDRTTPICGTTASTVLTITTTRQTPAGTYTMAIQGVSSAGIMHSRNVTLTVRGDDSESADSHGGRRNSKNERRKFEIRDTK
jgi:hypothetical protein